MSHTSEALKIFRIKEEKN